MTFSDEPTVNLLFCLIFHYYKGWLL
jgi:hypothetical protein